MLLRYHGRNQGQVRRIGCPPSHRQARPPSPAAPYHEGAMKPDWTDLGSIDDLPEGALVLRKDATGRRYACVRQGDVVHALDDRCPHQGYPLSQGCVKDGVLTCEWHNWKF